VINVVPLPPNPFPKMLNTRWLPLGTTLHRIFSVRDAARTFNSTAHRLARFSPIFDRQGQVVPVLYAGSSLQAALLETLFHDAPVQGCRRRTLPARLLAEKRYGRWVTQRSLKVATLHAPDLARFAVTIDQLIATNARYYPQTARWAEAIHANHPDVVGLEWPSYRASPELAFMVFGDRVRNCDLIPMDLGRDVMSDAALLSAVLECGQRMGVRVHAADPASLGGRV
jgi:hypothetical protein